MDTKLKTKYKNSICIAVLAGLAATTVFLFLNNIYESFEGKTLDLRFQLRGPIAQRQDIIFIEMDQPAIESLGRWPWPRETFAHIVEVLKEFKTRAVLFDVTFDEPAQLIIDKEKLDADLKIGENKKLLDNFINDTQEGLKEQQIDILQVNNALGQLKDGIDLWSQNINNTLSESTKDSDQIFSEAINNAKNVYLGYHFEVIHTPLDIQRDQEYEKSLGLLSNWIKQNPDKNFQELPIRLKNIPGFNLSEANSIFTRAKLHKLILENYDLSLEDAAKILNEPDSAKMRPYYNNLKNEALRERLEDILKLSPELGFKELSWKMNIFGPTNLKSLQRQYQDYLLIKTLSEKVSIPYSEKTGLPKAVKISPPIMILTQNMKSAGFLNAIADSDGTLRRAPLFVRYKERLYPHIAMQIIFNLWGIDPQKDISIAPGKFIMLGKNRIPLDNNGYMLVNWAGTWQDSFKHLSAGQIYRFWELKNTLNQNQSLSPEELQNNNLAESIEDDKKKLAQMYEKLIPSLKDKICIIGLTAPGTHDYTPIPLESDYPAVGTHANVLNTILSGKFLHRISANTNIVIIFFLGIFTALCVSLLSPAYSFIFILLTAFSYCLISFLLFAYRGLWIDIIGPLGTAITSYIGIISYNFATEEKEKKWIRNAFGHYISKNVMEEILKDPAKLRLGGERKELSVLFADIRGFTSFSEKRQPEEVVSQLNEYLDEMTKIIFKNNGTLDKYVGDEIMAIFGAPSASVQTDHAQKAVITAIEMMQRLKQLQEKWIKEGKEPLDIGIGINSGPMLVGNMGSSERMDYTVIGDAVNLAARVEKLTRTYNNHIIISEFTYAYVKDIIEAKPLDAIKVKGKETSVMMYEVLGIKK